MTEDYSCTVTASVTASISGGQKSTTISRYYGDELYKAINSQDGGSVLMISKSSDNLSTGEPDCLNEGSWSGYVLGAHAGAIASNTSSVSIATVNSGCSTGGATSYLGDPNGSGTTYGYRFEFSKTGGGDVYVSSLGPAPVAVTYSGSGSAPFSGNISTGTGSVNLWPTAIYPVAIAYSSDGDSSSVAPTCGNAFSFTKKINWDGVASKSYFDNWSLYSVDSVRNSPFQTCKEDSSGDSYSQTQPDSPLAIYPVGYSISVLSYPAWPVTPTSDNIAARNDWIEAKLAAGKTVTVTTYEPVYAAADNFEWPATTAGLYDSLQAWAGKVNFSYSFACSQFYSSGVGPGCGGAGQPPCPPPCDNDPATPNIPDCPAPCGVPGAPPCGPSCDNDPNTSLPDCPPVPCDFIPDNDVADCPPMPGPGPCDNDPATPAPLCPPPCDNDPATPAPLCPPPPGICGTPTTPPCPCGVSGTPACPLPCDDVANNNIVDCSPPCDNDPNTSIPDCHCGIEGRPACATPCGGTGQPLCSNICGAPGLAACLAPCDNIANNQIPDCSSGNEDFWCEVSPLPSSVNIGEQVNWAVVTGGSNMPPGSFTYQWIGSENVDTTTAVPSFNKTYSDDGYALMNMTVTGSGKQAHCFGQAEVKRPLGVVCEGAPSKIKAGYSTTAANGSAANSVLWTAYAVGGAGGYSYSWNGDLPDDAWDTSSSTLSGVYVSTGVKSVDVTVTDVLGNSFTSENCSVEVLPYEVECGPSSDIVGINGAVTWSASPRESGASISYDYDWEFSDASSGSGASVQKSYNSAGVQTAKVNVVQTEVIDFETNQTRQLAYTFDCSPLEVRSTVPSCTLSADPQSVPEGSVSEITVDFLNFSSPVGNASADCGPLAQTVLQPSCTGTSGTCTFTCGSVSGDSGVTVNLSNSTESASCNTAIAASVTQTNQGQNSGLNFVSIDIASVPSSRPIFSIYGNIDLKVTVRRLDPSVSAASFIVSRSKLDEPGVLLPSMPVTVNFPPENNEVVFAVPAAGLAEGNYSFTAAISSISASSTEPENVISDNVSRVFVLLVDKKPAAAPEINVLFAVLIAVLVIAIILQK